MVLGRWGRIVGWVLVACGVVLLGTGAWLSFGYEPQVDGGRVLPNPPPSDLATANRLVHRGAAFVLLGVLVAVAGVVVVQRIRRRRPSFVRWAPLLAGGLVLTTAAAATGSLVAFDQVAARSFSDAYNLRGVVQPLLEDSVAFFLFGNAEVSKATVATWFVVHAVVIPAAFAPVLVRARRRSGSQVGTLPGG